MRPATSPGRDALRALERRGSVSWGYPEPFCAPDILSHSVDQLLLLNGFASPSRRGSSACSTMTTSQPLAPSFSSCCRAVDRSPNEGGWSSVSGRCVGCPWRNGCSLLQQDRDFQHIARHTGLCLVDS